MYIKEVLGPNIKIENHIMLQGVANNILRGTIEDMDISNNGHVCFHWLEFRYNLLGQTGPK